MADEITLTCNLRLNNSGFKDSFNPGLVQIDQAAQGVWTNIVNIGTTEEDVTLAELTTEGICIMQNLDSTNYVEWGKKDGTGNMQAIGRLKPKPSASEPAFPAIFNFNPGATLRMKADTAACEVRITVYEA